MSSSLGDPQYSSDAVAGYGFADATESATANRHWWDHDAVDYHRDHPAYLSSFYWCPEMLHEDTANLLGDVTGLDVLEVGCGSAPCSRWLTANRQARSVTAFDISYGMLAQGRQVSGRQVSGEVELIDDMGPTLVQADAAHMPFSNKAFDIAFSVFGAVPFVADSGALMAEVARVLRPGGRWVFAVTHPMRWVFPDDPGPAGLIPAVSYFDRTPYVERDSNGVATYVEHHRTLGDRIRDLHAAGFHLEDLIEPEWPATDPEPFGQWSKLRGELFPGTAIFVCQKR
ncbi:class I SAM-dependent methyltransferase [Corynebacterium ulceribovis]|uniref:class I SAM-dependent methyltransferase n=1 Tax=Corynebacterium ulceribovis TaxID=487732 RepID=UPI00036FF8FC|nr:class I SAM-dependent methyltransferase [Corynebacterium ulceribovis]